MLELKTKLALSKESHTLAVGQSLVRFRSGLYMPADYETGASDVPPDPERTMWVPLDREAVRLAAAAQFDTLFANDSELANFYFMVSQHAKQFSGTPETLLIKTDDGLRELCTDGKLRPSPGNFRPNTMLPFLNEDEADKQRVFDVIAEWLTDADEAHSLLRHLATALAPGWSAVKYVLLLGEGRNGKSLLLKMLQAIFGWENCSNITRQQIAESNPVTCELNGKLLNLVFDGRSEYVKDSGNEKSLVAGETIGIRRLYESTPTPVQTNALFIEGLNHEPKSKDKSSALQKRLMRFHFPNVYAEDRVFEKQMLSPDSTGALLSLLIDHYVVESHIARALLPSSRAMELQLEHMYSNSMALQYIKHLEEKDPFGADGLLGDSISELAAKFQSWRISENDLTTWAEPDVLALFVPMLNTERKSQRVNGTVRKVRVVSGFKPEALAFLESLKGEEDDVEALVAD